MEVAELIDPTQHFIDTGMKAVALTDCVLTKNVILGRMCMGDIPDEDEIRKIENRFDNIILKAFGFKEKAE
jgi:hypothetical protein